MIAAVKDSEQRVRLRCACLSSLSVIWSVGEFAMLHQYGRSLSAASVAGMSTVPCSACAARLLRYRTRVCPSPLHVVVVCPLFALLQDPPMSFFVAWNPEHIRQQASLAVQMRPVRPCWLQEVFIAQVLWASLH